MRPTLSLSIHPGVLVGAGAILVWCALALVGLLRETPFRVATRAAIATGGWSQAEVRFDRGSYQFRLFYSVSTAQLTVVTKEGEFPVHVEMRHVPFQGWSLRKLELPPARARSPRQGPLSVPAARLY